MWEITEDIKYKKEVKEIIKSIEPRVLKVIKKFIDGNVNHASLPAFWLGLQSDIDDGLKKANKGKSKPYKEAKEVLNRLKERNIKCQ